MAMKKIGAITIGQSPRPDVFDDVKRILGCGIEIIEAGALDGLSEEELREVEPRNGEGQLVTKLRDGTTYIGSERGIYAHMQEQIDQLQEQGVELIAVGCCGNFPEWLHADVPLVFPRHILDALVPAVSSKKRIAVISNLTLKEQWKEIWRNTAIEKAYVMEANPYGEESWSDLQACVENIKTLDVDTIVMDCIAFTDAAKQWVREQTGLSVFCSRTTLAHTLAEILAVNY